MARHDTTHDAHAVSETKERAPRERPPAAQAPHYHSTADAAPRLGVSEEGLRARCRRARRSVGGETVADLGAGIRAVKFGRTWRVRFPKDEPA